MQRNELQQQAVDAWIKSNCRGAIICGTGVGKGLIGMKCIEYHIEECVRSSQVPNIIWITNSERLRDNDTIEDFKKWNKENLLPFISFECIQTAYKWFDRSYTLVVNDEADFSITPAYSRFFFNNHYDCLLLLTATVDKSKQELLDSLCPTVYKYSTVEAQDNGILNKSKIIVANYLLDNTTKNVASKGKGGKVFYQTENDTYAYLEKRCIAELLNLNNAKQDSLDWCLLNADINEELLKKESNAIARHKFWTNKRANFLWSLKSSISITRSLLAGGITKYDTHKALVFSKRTEQVEQICPITYHAKNAKDNTALEDLSSGKSRIVGVVQAVNRGVNISGLTHLIFESYDGSKTAFQQRYGKNSLAIIYLIRRSLSTYSIW